MKDQPAPPVGTPIIITNTVLNSQLEAIGKYGVVTDVVADPNIKGAVFASIADYRHGEEYLWLEEEYAVASPNWEFIYARH